MEFRRRSHRERQRPRSREAWPSLESGGVKENDEAGSFFRILEKTGERSCLAPRAVRAARAAFHSHPWSQLAMWSSPRSRTRFNRACVRRALASLSTTEMLFLQSGGVNPAGTPLSSMVCVSLRLLADPRAVPYAGATSLLGATALSPSPIVSDRASMPEKTAVVPLDYWLLLSLVSVWNHPESEASCAPVAPRYFDVNVSEWRALCRRMLRSGSGGHFIQRHLLLISLVGHSQFLRILIGTDLSDPADPATTHWEMSFALASSTPAHHSAK